MAAQTIMVYFAEFLLFALFVCTIVLMGASLATRQVYGTCDRVGVPAGVVPKRGQQPSKRG